VYKNPLCATLIHSAFPACACIKMEETAFSDSQQSSGQTLPLSSGYSQASQALNTAAVEK